MTYFFFFFNDTATTEIYTLSLHDALPISADRYQRQSGPADRRRAKGGVPVLLSGVAQKGYGLSDQLRTGNRTASGLHQFTATAAGRAGGFARRIRRGGVASGPCADGQHDARDGLV